MAPNGAQAHRNNTINHITAQITAMDDTGAIYHHYTNYHQLTDQLQRLLSERDAIRRRHMRLKRQHL